MLVYYPVRLFFFKDKDTHKDGSEKKTTSANIFSHAGPHERRNEKRFEHHKNKGETDQHSNTLAHSAKQKGLSYCFVLPIPFSPLLIEHFH